MAGIQLSGLVSGSFNWQSVVDQLIQLDTAPVTRLQTEQSANNDKIASLASVKSGLTDLQTAVKALQADGLFNGRSAVSTTTGSTWSASAANGTAAGSYAIAVSQLASTTKRLGAGNISSGLSTTSNVSSLTLATLPITTPVTAGTLTVDGRQVSIALTDSLQDVFDKIHTATGNNVTGSYDPLADKISLTAADHTEVVLGAANDTSNFFTALRLENNGTDTIASSSKLSNAALTAPLTSSRLRSAITAVDGSGNGTFSVNGVAVTYNVNTDSLSDVLTRINASSAGVTASYDSAADRVVLTNKTTGDTGLGVSEPSGGLLDALGLTGSSTLQRGNNAHFTVNGGATLSSTSNSLNAAALGVTGLSVNIDSETTQTVAVTPNTAAMKTAIQGFIDKFNTLQTFIDDQTQITVTKGSDNKVVTSTLSHNLEVQTWASQLRSLAFGQVTGLTGAIQRLDNLGIDFDGTSSQLKIKDSSKLDAALNSNSSDVGAFFGGTSGGFAQQINSYAQGIIGPSGLLDTQTNTLTTRNTGLANQITTLQTWLATERTRLTNSFILMQQAQSQAQSQLAALNNFFNTTPKQQ